MKEGWRCARGEGGGYLWFSAKLVRWAAIWLGLWALDCELLRSGGDAKAVPSEPPGLLALLPGVDFAEVSGISIEVRTVRRLSLPIRISPERFSLMPGRLRLLATEVSELQVWT